MSLSKPPLSSMAHGHRALANAPPLDIRAAQRWRPMAPSSSPARSSSQPRTPYSSRDTDSFAYIQSSPTISYSLDSPSLKSYSEDPYCGLPHLSNPAKVGYQPSTRYSRYDTFDHSPSSELEIEDFVDDANISLPEIDSETTSDSVPGHGSLYFSDSEEEVGLGNAGGDAILFFGYSSLRSTSFRISSERGQWKDDPMALTASATSNLTARLRQSVPTPSRHTSESPSLSLRPVSMPLPSPIAEQPFFRATHNHTVACERTKEDVLLASAQTEGAPLHDPPPPSVERRALSPKPNITPGYSSLLPPSSPMLSPMSGCVSLMSRSVSPLSLPPSSPLMAPSSPLCFLDEPVDEQLSNLDDSPPTRIDKENHKVDPVPVGVPLRPTSVPSFPSAGDLPVIAEARNSSDAAPSTPLDAISALTPSAQTTKLASTVVSAQKSGAPDENTASGAVVGKQRLRARDDGQPLRDQDDNTELASTEPKKKKRSNPKLAKASSSATTTKRKAESVDDSDGPPKKRRQGNTGGDNVASSSTLGSTGANNPAEGDADRIPQTKVTKGGKKRVSKKDRVGQLSTPESPRKGHFSELVPEEIDPEMKGLLIECMATSRASSMPVSLLSRMVLQAHPDLKSQRTDKEWKKVICRVLVNGTAGRGNGVFGKVDSSGKDDSDRPLEAQWFYVPELDEDQERAAVICSMMPRPGKRSVTKKYKQYYWRPLEKISQWDPEDEL